jgi:hypothetical protein
MRLAAKSSLFRPLSILEKDWSQGGATTEFFVRNRGALGQTAYCGDGVVSKYWMVNTVQFFITPPLS